MGLNRQSKATRGQRGTPKADKRKCIALPTPKDQLRKGQCSQLLRKLLKGT